MSASEQIGFEQIGLGSLLKRYRLRVPPNQREYSWTAREVTTLLQDFAKCIADGEYQTSTSVALSAGAPSTGA